MVLVHQYQIKQGISIYAQPMPNHTITLQTELKLQCPMSHGQITDTHWVGF